MLGKLVIQQAKYVAFTPPLLASAFLMPILLYAVLPGFNTAAFPAFIVWFIPLTLSSGDQGVHKARVILDHFPVTWKDYAASLFPFQVLVIALAGLYTSGFMLAAGRLGGGPFPRLILPKAMALALGLGGILCLLSLRMPRDAARLVTLGLLMALSLLPVLYRNPGNVFLPWLSLPLCLLMGLAVFILCLAFSLGLPLKKQRRRA